MHRATQHTQSASVSPRPCPLRAAFTLIELLMVISIIGILLAILVPAVYSAFVKAKVAQVKADIDGLDSALSAFHGQYGVYPPSRIRLHETAAGWTSDPASRVLIRRIWPEFDFSYSGETPPGSMDINGDGDKSDTIVLDGSECLVFFLGGVPQKDTTSGLFAMLGFSSNPQNPFSRTGTSRTTFFKFEDTSRLDDDDSPPDGMPDYHDIFNADGGKPYIYISTNNATNSYRTNLPNPLPDAPTSTMTMPYHQGGASKRAWKPDSFQIISPGIDQEYGLGGEYNAENAAALLSGNRSAEKDNITNFHGGPLSP